MATQNLVENHMRIATKRTYQRSITLLDEKGRRKTQIQNGKNW